MRPQLPPERPLDAPEQMVDTILTESQPNTGPQVAPRRTVNLPLLAAGIAGLVGAVIVLTLRPWVPEAAGPAATPINPVSAAPSVPGGPAPGPSPSSVADPTRELRTGDTAVIGPLTITVRQETREVDDVGIFAYAEVCLRTAPVDGSTVTTSRSAWAAVTEKGRVLQPGATGTEFDEPAFPGAAAITVGHCVSGWIAFPGAVGLGQLRYAGPDGAVSWVPMVFSHPAPSQIPLGKAHAGPYVDVVVDRRYVSSEREYAIRIETCVRQLPADAAPDGLLLSREAWILETSKGTATSRDRLTQALPLPTTYPDGIRLRAGQCASGYLPFAVKAGADLVGVEYANALGDHVFWRAQPGR